MHDMRIAFAGDRDIGVWVLKFILSQGVRPLALLLPEAGDASNAGELISHCPHLEDGQILRGTEFRQEQGIKFLTQLDLDFIVCAHFAYIMPGPVLAIPRVGVLNLHPAYLPYNRGWHTPSWALLDQTPIGATLHFMDNGIDTGDIIHQKLLDVSPADTADPLYHRLKCLELEVFEEAWPRLRDGSFQRQPQDPAVGTIHKRKELFAEKVQKIDLNERVEAGALIRRLRALTTNSKKEAAYFETEGKRYRVQIQIAEEARETPCENGMRPAGGGTMDILRPEQQGKWMDVLARSAQHDFHHLPEYHRLAEDCGEGTAHLFSWREGDYTIALPLLLRPVNQNAAGEWNDATSVYGYCGPVASHERMPELVVRNFQAALGEQLVGRRVISAFSRLHPLIAQHGLLAGLGECVPAGQTISIDLTAGPEAQTAHYRSDHVRDIAWLRKLGVTCIHDQEGRYLEAFIEMYLDTMRRVGADTGYFFDRAYFDRLTSDLGASVHLFVCLLEGKPVSAGMVTTANGIVQGHLAGSASGYRKLASNKLLIDSVRVWATERGYKTFHLGGGVGARLDSLFSFKAGFSDRRHEFSTWRWIVNPEIYRELCERRNRANQEQALEPVSADYFPTYRCATISRASSAHAARGQFSVLQTAQEEEWKSVLARVAQHDFYHLAEYHRLAEKRGEGSARLFTWREGDHTIALPLLLRPVKSNREAWSDATSVYGYAGPLASHADMPASVVRSFQEALKDALVGRRVATAYSRLHPLIAQRELLAGLGECRMLGQTVSIDLTLPPEAQRAQYRSAFKTRINKLRRDGVVCLHDEEQRHLGDFVSIYHETMRRVDAHDSYFFGEDYFAGLVSGLGPKLQLFVATVDGKAVAGALITICDGIVQYHLGGTRGEFLGLSPTGLIFDTVRLWAHEKGARVFHLGGGVGSKEDSLFHFKAGFSDCRHSFGTWRWVIVPEVYAELCQQRLQTDLAAGLEPISTDYFPAYRCPAVRRTVPSEPVTTASASVTVALESEPGRTDESLV